MKDVKNLVHYLLTKESVEINRLIEKNGWRDRLKYSDNLLKVNVGNVDQNIILKYVINDYINKYNNLSLYPRDYSLSYDNSVIDGSVEYFVTMENTLREKYFDYLVKILIEVINV